MELSQDNFNIPSDMPVSHLERMRSKLDGEIKARREQQRLLAAQRLKEVANDFGFQIRDLLPLLDEKRNRFTKYRHPSNPNLIWCGRGRRPLWMTDALKEGVPLSEMVVST